MGILNRIVVGTAPWMPKFVVGRIAAVYVAGDKLEDGINNFAKLFKIDESLRRFFKKI